MVFVSSRWKNNGGMDNKNTIEVISCHKNSAGLIDHTCDENGISLLNT